jgi:hypothetical protein
VAEIPRSPEFIVNELHVKGKGNAHLYKSAHLEQVIYPAVVGFFLFIYLHLITSCEDLAVCFTP